MIGNNKFRTLETFISPGDDEVAWEVEGDPRCVIKMKNNIAKFDMMMGWALKSKMVRKMAMSNLSNDELQALDDMLMRQTTIEIIHEATAEELVEANKSFWQRIKDKWIGSGAK